MSFRLRAHVTCSKKCNAKLHGKKLCAATSHAITVTTWITDRGTTCARQLTCGRQGQGSGQASTEAGDRYPGKSQEWRACELPKQSEQDSGSCESVAVAGQAETVEELQDTDVQEEVLQRQQECVL